MNWRTTAGLFLVLVLLAAIVYWQQRQEPEPVEPTPGLTQPIPVELVSGVGATDIVSISVSDLNNDLTREFELNEDDGLWYQTVPTYTAMLTPTMLANVSGLARLTSRRALEPEANPLSVYGLDEPDYSFTFRADRNDQTIRYLFLVGNETPTGDAFYIQREGDERVHVAVPTNIQNMIDLLTSPPIVVEATPTP